MFDAYAFLKDNFPNEDAIATFLDSYGIEAPGWHTTHKWFVRRSIPFDWLTTLLVHMEMERGLPVSLVKYYVRAA